MGNGSNWLWIAALVAVGVAVLFLVGGPQPATAVTTPTTTVAPVSQPVSSTATKPAIAPYVNAGPDITINPCASVQLTCVGYDPTGGPVTYHWTAAGGQGSFSNASALHPIYTAPPTCGCGKNVVLTLTVTTARGVSASDNMVVHVRPAWSHPAVEQCQPVPPPPCCTPPAPPCTPPPPCCSRMYVPAPCPASHASLTPLISRALPTVINSGQPLQLHGRITGPSCNISRIYWSADKGSFVNITSLNPVYFAPVINHCGGEDVTIDLNVIDINGVRTYDQVRIHINPTQ